jgi:hypothetical protein
MIEGPVAEDGLEELRDRRRGCGSLRQWASREDLLGPRATDQQRAEAKRATIVVRIPKAERPWKPLDA